VQQAARLPFPPSAEHAGHLHHQSDRFMSSGTGRNRRKALDHFEVIGELGQGAASRILHIRDPATNQHFALKVVIARSPDEQKFLDQAKHEYEVAQKFDHPSLVKVFDIRVTRKWFRDREVRTLLEYVNGVTLEQIKEPGLPLLLVVFTEVAGAVAYMHRCGVFHADLKPNNIMVSGGGQVKVIDFGLAWVRGEKKGRVQGTMGYLAPEQMRDRVVNEATDIFNFGATMYRMLTGRLASAGITSGGSIGVPGKTVITPVLELKPDVPEELCKLVDRCCANRPQKRPGSMVEVANTLTKIRDAMNLSADDLPRLLREIGHGAE
jgi:serine/threonine-protein kinase